MAMEKKWIKRTVAVIMAFLFVFALAQMALTFTLNISWGVFAAGILINTSVEMTGIGLLLFPTIWLGISASISRHRGVYIMTTVLCCLSLLMSIGFLVYESYYYSLFAFFNIHEQTMGITVTKLVLWCLMVILLIVLLGVLIAADISKSKPDFKYYHYGGGNQPYQQAMVPFPPEYSGRSYRDYQQQQPHQRQQPSKSSRHQDYPRMYYGNGYMY